MTGRCPFDVLLLVITFAAVLTKPLGSALDTMSPTWINTGGGSDLSDPFDTTTDPLITSTLLDSAVEVTGNSGIRVSVASLIGEVLSAESMVSFTVDVVLDASPFSMVGVDSMVGANFCLFLFFFFFFFAVAV